MLEQKNFKLNTLEKNSLYSLNKLKNFIDSLVLENNYQNLLKKINLLTNFKIEILSLKLKKLILNQFNYKNNLFIKENKLINLFHQFFIFIIIFFKLVFAAKNVRQTNSNIILTNVDHIDEIEKFKKVLSLYENSTIITKRKIDFSNLKKYVQDKYLKENLEIVHNNDKLIFSYKDKDECYKINTKIICEQNIRLNNECLVSNLKSFFYGIIIFYESIKTKTNLLKFFNIILYSVLKNYTIFSSHKGEYLIQDRIYYTCPIKNFIFKRMGGKKTACVQSHLSEGSINLYNDIDIFFTFGEETNSIKFLKDMGSNIIKTFAVGSLRTESYLYKASEKYHIDDKIDILIIGVNLYSWLYLNENTKKNYYEYYHYLKKISEKYEKLKICIKHHPNNKLDSFEKEIIEKSNITYIDKSISSYRLLKNTKLFLSFSSSLILETCGAFGKSYFLDPNNNNNVFFEKNDHLNKIKIVGLSDLEKIIEDIFLKKNIHQYEKNHDDICLNSLNTSNLIKKGLTITHI